MLKIVVEKREGDDAKRAGLRLFTLSDAFSYGASFPLFGISFPIVGSELRLFVASFGTLFDCSGEISFGLPRDELAEVPLILPTSF